MCVTAFPIINISPIQIGIPRILSKGIKQHAIKEEIDSASTRPSEHKFIDLVFK